MKTENEDNVEREKMTNLLIKRYGKRKESTRIEFVNITNKEIAEELAYDSGQLNRIFNPFNKKNSAKTFRKVIQRLNLITENEELKEKSIKMGIISFLPRFTS